MCSLKEHVFIDRRLSSESNSDGSQKGLRKSMDGSHNSSRQMKANTIMVFPFCDDLSFKMTLLVASDNELSVHLFDEHSKLDGTTADWTPSARNQFK